MLREPSLYSLEDLEAATGFGTRRIRSWIQAGVLPPPHGRGPGPHYGEQHLERLRFIARLPSDRIPIDYLRQIFSEVPRETIRRVADGEEPVTMLHGSALFMQADEVALPEPAAARHPEGDVACSPPFPDPPRRLDPPRSKPAREDPTPWTTIEIEDGLELRMRGDEPDRVAWLARLARRLRVWVARRE